MNQFLTPTGDYWSQAKSFGAARVAYHHTHDEIDIEWSRSYLFAFLRAVANVARRSFAVCIEAALRFLGADPPGALLAQHSLA